MDIQVREKKVKVGLKVSLIYLKCLFKMYWSYYLLNFKLTKILKKNCLNCYRRRLKTPPCAGLNNIVCIFGGNKKKRPKAKSSLRLAPATTLRWYRSSDRFLCSGRYGNNETCLSQYPGHQTRTGQVWVFFRLWRSRTNLLGAAWEESLARESVNNTEQKRGTEERCWHFGSGRKVAGVGCQSNQEEGEPP